MTRPHWKVTLGADGVLDAVSEAARACMRETCQDHDPASCSCPEQMMTPLEFHDWLQAELLEAGRRPTRLDHSETRQAGQSRRRTLEAHLAASA